MAKNDEVTNQIRDSICHVCPLYKKSKIVRDKGKAKVSILFVGEAPHTTELETGIPFSGRSGDLLDKLMDYIGVSRSDTYIANALKCKIDKANMPDRVLREALKCCRPYLESVIKQVDFKLLVILGDKALRQVHGKKGIIKYRGRFMPSEEFDCPTFITVHPAYILRASQKNFPNIPFERMNAREKSIFRDFDYIKKFFDAIKKGAKNAEDVALMYDHRYTQVKHLDGFMRRTPLAFDLEWDPETGKLICASFCVAEGDGRVLFFENASKKAMGQLKKIMANPEIRKIVANRPSDENKLKEIGIPVEGTIYDVFTMAHLVDENIPKISLEMIANTYTNLHNIKDMAQGQRTALKDADKNLVVEYSAVDADATFRAFNVLRKELLKDKRLVRYYGKFILPIENMLAKISTNGCRIDVKRLKRNEKKCKTEMAKMHSELLEAIPSPIKDKYKDNLSLTRPALIVDYMFTSRAKGALKLKPKEVTEKTKVPSTRADHLMLFSHIPWVEKYLKWKQLQKILSTYLSPMYDYIHNDGKIYPSILLYRTVTGRTSIIDPAIQQIPQRGSNVKLVREIFVADKGWLFGSRDLAQSEIRIMGWQANEKAILRALENHIDLHSLTASNVLGIPIDKVTKAQRQKAKPVNFGFLYGMHAPSFVRYAKIEYGIDYTLKEAEHYRELFFESYPAIRGFHAYMSRVASEQGHVYTPLGRKRRLPAIHSKDRFLRSAAIRQAINTPIQSFSSDLALLAMYLFQEEIEKNPKLRENVKILWFKHDEIFFTARTEVMPLAMETLKKCTEQKTKEYFYKEFKLVVGYPIESDGKVGKDWERMKTYKD